MEVRIEKGVKVQKETQSATKIADREEQTAHNKESRTEEGLSLVRRAFVSGGLSFSGVFLFWRCLSFMEVVFLLWGPFGDRSLFFFWRSPSLFLGGQVRLSSVRERSAFFGEGLFSGRVLVRERSFFKRWRVFLGGEERMEGFFFLVRGEEGLFLVRGEEFFFFW